MHNHINIEQLLAKKKIYMEKKSNKSFEIVSYVRKMI